MIAYLAEFPGVDSNLDIVVHQGHHARQRIRRHEQSSVAKLMINQTERRGAGRGGDREGGSDEPICTVYGMKTIRYFGSSLNHAGEVRKIRTIVRGRFRCDSSKIHHGCHCGNTTGF